jgi:hypothetical protein
MLNPGGPGPAQRALTKISTTGTYLEAGFRGQIQIRRNQGEDDEARPKVELFSGLQMPRPIPTADFSSQS